MPQFPINGLGVCMNDTGAGDAAGTQDEPSMNYENTDIQEITRRQLREDIMAYRYDLDLCRSLIATDVTPQEARGLQLRTLDIGHQIRNAQHRIELIEARQRQSRTSAPVPYHDGVHMSHRDSMSGQLDSPSNVSTYKRPRLSLKRSYSAEDVENGGGGDTSHHHSTINDMKGESFTPVNGHHAHPSNGAAHGSSAVQRLGFWKCRLCVASKYLNAGPNRVPSEPSKWPLKDVSKMLNHFLDLHTEHTPSERCMELGFALAQNSKLLLHCVQDHEFMTDGSQGVHSSTGLHKLASKTLKTCR